MRARTHACIKRPTPAAAAHHDRPGNPPLRAQAEIRTTLYETKLSDDLHRLDAFIAQQPQLNDGSRWCARVTHARTAARLSHSA
jgi:hypothetical protein